MKVLITGANGQLGYDLVRVFRNSDIIKLDHNDIEVANYESVWERIRIHQPDCVINTAAYHNVPDCEKHTENALRINGLGAYHLTKACKTIRAKLVHISTDYVFDGKKNAPYVEQDTPRLLNVYAISKLTGEYFIKQNPSHYIVRVASLFGIAGCRAKGGKNFVETMLKLAKERDTVHVTSNIICSPTYTHDAALQIRKIIQDKYPAGIYHVVNQGSCSWYEFALEIFRQTGQSVKIEPKEEKEELKG